MTAAAYQVVPMLQLTPAYAKGIIMALTWAMPIALAVFTAGWFLPAPPARGVEALALLLGMTSAVAFALATLKLHGQRRRKQTDVTLDFWRLGMVSLIGVALLLPAAIILKTSVERARRRVCARGWQGATTRRGRSPQGGATQPGARASP